MPTGHYPRPPVEVRLWNKVLFDDGCWLWVGSKDRDGYGQMWANGRLRCASRLVLGLLGVCLDGLEACHTCDTPSCVRPSHLFAGTKLQNMDDARRKGRTTKKLKRGDRVALRAAYEAGETIGSLAKKYDIDWKSAWWHVRDLEVW